MKPPLPDIDREENRLLCPYLAGLGRWPDLPVIARPEQIIRPYDQLGTHPDLVARLWDELGGVLPEDCRYVVYGRPALVHPGSGIIFAFAGGTHTYGLRLPEALAEEAIRAGASRFIRYPDQTSFDVTGFGPGWILGNWLRQEPTWCRSAYDHAGSAG
jgi:hypothetical protein